MTLIADFYLETPVLQATLAAAPDADISIEQQTSRGTKPFAIAFWVSGTDFEAFEAALADDPTVTDASVLAEVDDQRLYQAELTAEGEALMTYNSWADLGGVFVSSERAGNGWRARIRFPDRESLREYAEFCREHGLRFELRQLYSAGGRGSETFGLTDRQYETLRTATEMGYFSIPREAELEDLAEVLGVSRQAISERLRRATQTLVRATIYGEDPDAETERENEAEE